ncbi:LysM peptidoglycan-binding domain-containing protein, partial [Salmonella enterica subsp. enterica serovar Istanbul]|nr:LysM peptidoglycan-binding domain-containing protein [Salmonella enterica subsp. enterica serovar Istanbul]
SSSSSESSSGTKYVTVEAGQGVYRVATNAGISVDKLLELNGLSSDATISAGQRLRVR